MAKGNKAAVKVESTQGVKARFDEATLKALCGRWREGVALKELAVECDVTWQTLAGHFIAKGWKRDVAPAPKAGKKAPKAEAPKSTKAAKAAP